MIFSKGYTKAVDWWAFGVLVYEMLAGYSPFYAEDQMTLCQNIISGQFQFDENFSDDSKDLLNHLLQLDVTKRYGNLKNGADDLKKHRWFHSINWIDIFQRKTKPPYVPKTTGSADTSYFDTYEEESLVIANEDLYTKQFQDF